MKPQEINPIEVQYQRFYENGLKRLLSSKEISENNKKILSDFINQCHADGIKTKRVVKLIGMIRKIAEWSEFDFQEASKQDITNLIADKIERSEFKDWTKWSYKRVIKKLYKFLDKEDLVKDIRVSFKKESRISPEQVLTEEDVKKMIEVSSHPRDRALISLIAEIGMRSEEIRRMRLKHFAAGENPTVIVPGCKDSPNFRELPVVDSVPYLVKWIEMHPDRSNPDSYLFLSLSTNTHLRMLSGHSVNKIVQESASKAKIKKPSYPHAMRHARATYLGNHFTESQMNWWFGWKPGSKMAGDYVHLGRNHIEEAYYRLRGVCTKCKKNESLPKSDFCKSCIGTEKDVPTLELEPKVCQKCGSNNESVAEICSKCGFVFEIQGRIACVKKEKETYENVMGMVQKEIEKRFQDMKDEFFRTRKTA